MRAARQMQRRWGSVVVDRAWFFNGGVPGGRESRWLCRRAGGVERLP